MGWHYKVKIVRLDYYNPCMSRFEITKYSTFRIWKWLYAIRHLKSIYLFSLFSLSFKSWHTKIIVSSKSLNLESLYPNGPLHIYFLMKTIPLLGNKRMTIWTVVAQIHGYLYSICFKLLLFFIFLIFGVKMVWCSSTRKDV